MRVAHEHRFHTADEVAGYIAEAARIVVEAELHPDFQVPAFVKALDLLSAKHVALEQAAMPAMAIPSGRRY